MNKRYKVVIAQSGKTDVINKKRYIIRNFTCGCIVKKLLTEALISANIFYRKRCYREATVRLGYMVIKKAT